MQCGDDNILSAFADGALAPVLRSTVESHIDRCDDCRQVVSLLIGDTLSPSGVPPSAPSNRRASAIGRYQLREPLGSGAMGMVYRARDPALARDVAVKLLLSDTASGDPRSSRLWREAQAMAQLTHPNVVAVHDVGVDEGQVYLVMELVESSTLRDWLHATRPSWPAIVEMLVRAGHGLAAAHARGIVHRDFKPENVLVTADGTVKVADFGLANVEPRMAQGRTSVELISSLTATGTLLGTPLYMAPELLQGGTADERSDQFAFCVAAVELLAGQRPFSGSTIAELLQDIEKQRPIASPRVPVRLREVLQRGLRVTPDARWPSMRSLVDELEGSSHSRGRKKRKLLAATAAVVLAGSLLVLRQETPGEEPTERPSAPTRARAENPADREKSQTPVLEPAVTAAANDEVPEPAAPRQHRQAGARDISQQRRQAPFPSKPQTTPPTPGQDAPTFDDGDGLIDPLADKR